MNKKIAPTCFILIVFLMTPLRVSAMPNFFQRKQQPEEGGSTDVANIREHNRLATEVNRNNPSSNNHPGVDASEMENRAPFSSSLGVSELSNFQGQLGAVSDTKSDQNIAEDSAFLQQWASARKMRCQNIERIRSQASARVERAKTINPAFVNIIHEWHQTQDSAARDHILKTQLLIQGCSEQEHSERAQVAALLQEAHNMEQYVAKMEQEGSNETLQDAETIASKEMAQVASSENSAEQASLYEAHLQQEAGDVFTRLSRASKTMACLQACNLVAPSSMAESFFAQHVGGLKINGQLIRWDEVPLILNNGKSPVPLIVPATEGELQYTLVIPSIIPAGASITVDGVTTTARNVMIPPGEENLGVRKLVMEAFEAFYGPQVRDIFSDFDQKTDVLNVLEISNMFLAISKKYEENNTSIPEGAAQIENCLQNDRFLLQGIARRKFFEQTHDEVNERLASSNKPLNQLAWYAAETVVRSVGAVAKTVANIMLSKIGCGACVGATTATITTLAQAGLITQAASSLTAFSVTNVLGAGGGRMMGNALGLHEKEVQRSVVISSILTLALIPFFPHASLLVTVPTLGGIGAAGGALPFLFKPSIVTAAAQHAWDHYAPGTALEKARTALSYLINPYDGYRRTLKLMKEAQEIDVEEQEKLHNFFNSFALVKISTATDSTKEEPSPSSSSTTTAAAEAMKADETIIAPEPMSPARAYDILKNQIDLMLRRRGDLISRLQIKLDALKEKKQLIEQQAQAIFHSSDFRMYYPRGI